MQANAIKETFMTGCNLISARLSCVLLQKVMRFLPFAVVVPFILDLWCLLPAFALSLELGLIGVCDDWLPSPEVWGSLI